MIGSNRFCHFGGWSEREPPAQWSARSPRDADRPVWEELFAAYCDFYERPCDREHRERVWSWIEAGTIRCVLAVPAASPAEDAVGLAHVRPCPSPLRGATIGYLDDLFVAPAARGSGAFETLIGALRELGAAEGWALVRWITAADNDRARAAYERVATRTGWVTYDLDV